MVTLKLSKLHLKFRSSLSLSDPAGTVKGAAYSFPRCVNVG